MDTFDLLFGAVEKTREKLMGAAIDRFSYQLPESLNTLVQDAIEDWSSNGKMRRLWEHDASLWTGKDEGQWLGWLDVADNQLAHLAPLIELANYVRAQRFEHILLLGMGGSSLCPEVLELSFGQLEDYPELYILDSTDPAQIQGVQQVW
jgi:transaldolase / glucose-6-phosphate isomerase